MRARALLLTVLTTAAIASPAGAAVEDDPCYDADAEAIVLTEEQVWFHEGDSKVGNLADRGDQAPAPFDTEEPTASVQSGAGAGALSNLGSTESIAAGAQNSALFAGSFDGCMDTLLVEMYAFMPTNRTGSNGSGEEREHAFGGSLTIDGTEFEIFGPAETRTVANENGQATYRIRYAVTGIRNRMAQRNVALDGTHEIGLEMTAWFANTDNVVYVWDTTETPSGMTFNGTVDDTYAKVSL